MRTTRAEVAKLAGVSPSVVSYVLNGGPRNVAPETRRRVEEAIASLEYRPNAIAQALRGGRSGAIGVIVGGDQNRLFRAMSFALQKAALSYGYAMYVSFAADSAAERHYARSLVDRQVDALIAIEPEDSGLFGELRRDGLPVAFVGRTRAPRRLLALRADPSHAILEMLSAAGRRNASALIYSNELTPWLSRADVTAAINGGTPVTELETDTIAGGAELIRLLAAHPRAIVVAATDKELGRIRWLLGSAGLDPNHHIFASSRVDFRHEPAAGADIHVEWDLDLPFSTIFGELIRMIDDPDLDADTIELPWAIASGEDELVRASRVWDITDI